ncbi:PrsW family intramembrane metalloprotease [Demequina subtropica]|uniref:PrsW family intramembrane metalloprotease n=1 Tax=Demequina subtropica TaxID=1638989 RepID=UPI00078170DB|nr:PrsW family glutamic-type intramembrane protease [Demequina subtropica]
MTAEIRPYARQPRPRTATFVDARSWVFWTVVVLTLGALTQVAPLVLESAVASPASGAYAAFLWAAYGLVFASSVWVFELYERRHLVNVAGALVWGAIVAVGLAHIAGPAMHTIVGARVGDDSLWLSSISAPLVEEPLKVLGVVALALVPGARIRTVADGAFYGGMIGLGFQVVEGFLYTARTAALAGEPMETVTQMFVLRGIVAGLWSHAAFSAIAGAGVAFFFVSVAPALQRWAVALGALGAAMALHALLNSPVVQGTQVTSALIKGVPIVAVLLTTLHVSHLRERAVFARTARVTVPDHLVSPADFEGLSTRTRRRHARADMRDRHGRPAARDLHRLQRAQLALLVAAHSDGMISARAADAAGRVTSARSSLAWSIVGK